MSKAIETADELWESPREYQPRKDYHKPLPITEDLLRRLEAAERRLVALETRAEVEDVYAALRVKRARLGLCPETGRDLR
jgi:hypothetical protein